MFYDTLYLLLFSFTKTSENKYVLTYWLFSLFRIYLASFIYICFILYFFGQRTLLFLLLFSPSLSTQFPECHPRLIFISTTQRVIGQISKFPARSDKMLINIKFVIQSEFSALCIIPNIPDMGIKFNVLGQKECFAHQLPHQEVCGVKLTCVSVILIMFLVVIKTCLNQWVFSCRFMFANLTFFEIDPNTDEGSFRTLL